MKKKTYRRFDISDAKWKLIGPYMTGHPGQRGGIAKDNRKFINAVIWILKTGSLWRNLPRIMESRVQFIKNLFDGNEKVCGKNYLRY